MNDNMKRLEARTVAAAEAVLAAQKFVTAIDVLEGIGWLQQAQVDEWRQGRRAYLEGGVSTNLHKISAVMKMFRCWAQTRGLSPSETAYVSRTRDHHPLRFSKSGAPAIERAYRTHWLSPELSAAKQERLAERQGRAPDLVVISPLRDWTCSVCGDSGGDFLLMDDTGPLCRRCARLDHLVYLPAGDAALSRRAKRASGLSAIVVRFSRSRKRYERQGILIEESALKQAEMGLGGPSA